MRIKINPASLPSPRLPPTRDGKDAATQAVQDASGGPGTRGYTKAQDAVIREMRTAGYTYKAIADEIGRSEKAVQMRWYRLNGFV